MNGEAIVPRSASWKWWITGLLLLLATMINYMDRVTLANASDHETDDDGEMRHLPPPETPFEFRIPSPASITIPREMNPQPER